MAPCGGVLLLPSPAEPAARAIATLSQATNKRAQLKLTASPEGGDTAGGGGGGGSGGRAFTSKFRGVTAQSCDSGRWEAKLKHNGKDMYMGTFDREEDAARAWDRMMVWCDLHGIALKLWGRGGGLVHLGQY